MDNKYIFVKRTEGINSQNLSEIKFNTKKFMNPVKLMLNELFEWDSSKYNFIYNNEKYAFTYECTKMKNESYFITISVNYTPAKNAKLLEFVNNKIVKGQHRKHFTIVETFDSVSDYYCSKIFPKLSEFERKLRDLMYIILFESFGKTWFDETVSESLRQELLSQGLEKNKVIEMALYEMSIFQIECFLFTPKPKENITHILETTLSVSSINELNKVELIEEINKCRPVSLWNELFEDLVQVESIDTKLQEVRGLRNKVAHNKFFFVKDYKKAKKILDELIRQIDLAIESTIDKPFSWDILNDTMVKFSETLTKIGEWFAKDLKNASGLLAESMRESLNSYMKISLNDFNKDGVDFEEDENNIKDNQLAEDDEEID